ncbi:MAG: NAD-dependent deacylase [Polaribacter sp.]
MKNLVVLTGAGISAESGIQTFRDADGLWEGHDVMKVATPEGFKANPELVLDFYNQRRKQLLEVTPNKAHFNLQELEKYYDVEIITQNVDDLHERAGSKNIIHLHGELLKVRSSADENLVLDWRKDLVLGDLCTKKKQLRPHIVWFGEMVPMLDTAIEITKKADILVIIGTSMQVYPAASLVNFIKPNTPIYFIDPKPSVSKNDFNNLTIIKDVASSGTDKLLSKLIVNN